VAAALSLALATAALVFCLRLPRLVLDRFHRETARLGEDYRSLAAGVDIDWLAPGYRLRGVRVVRRDGKIATPLLELARVDVRLEPLARRSTVRIDGMRVHWVGGPGGTSQLGEHVPWRRFLDAMAPGTVVQRIDFADARVRFQRAREPALPVTLDNLHGAVDGLAADAAHFQAQGLLMAHAPLRIDARFDPRGPLDTLRLRARAREVELPRINAFARRWARLDFEGGEGEFGLSLDWTPPRIHGALVASLSGVDVSDLREDVGRRGVLGALRELVTGAGVALMQEPRTRRIDREFTIDAPVPALPEDNLEALQAVLLAAFADLGRYLPE
jgi:hypothetical protein